MPTPFTPSLARYRALQVAIKEAERIMAQINAHKASRQFDAISAAVRRAVLTGTPYCNNGVVVFETEGTLVAVRVTPSRDGLSLRSIETPLTSYAPTDLLSAAEIAEVERKVGIAVLADGEIDQWMCFLFGGALIGGSARR